VLSRLRRAAEIELAAVPAEVGEERGTGLDVAAHDTVPFCLWSAARHLDSYEEAIWTVTSQDGDRYTTGAIVGGIVVLATGVEGIPVLCGLRRSRYRTRLHSADKGGPSAGAYDPSRGCCRALLDGVQVQYAETVCSSRPGTEQDYEGRRAFSRGSSTDSGHVRRDLPGDVL
jgi:hypothetical protein